MKRSIIMLAVVVLVVISTTMWISSSLFSSIDILHFGVILVLVGFALFLAFKRINSTKRGEPVEDELSVRIVQKAAAYSFYISLYIWVFILYIKDRTSMDIEELIGGGILSMGLTFAISWVIVNYKGFRNE